LAGRRRHDARAPTAAMIPKASSETWTTASAWSRPRLRADSRAKATMPAATSGAASAAHAAGRARDGRREDGSELDAIRVIPLNTAGCRPATAADGYAMQTAVRTKRHRGLWGFA